MKTSQDISTISYNSPEFLSEYLNTLYRQHKIAFWAFVVHIGETLDDGTVEKNHAHVFIEPNCPLDTMGLVKGSEEFDPEHPEHPLKCIYFRKSRWADWLLYALHDSTYLKLKLEKRDYSYQYEDFYYSDPDEFFERFNVAMHSSTISEMIRLPKLLKQHSVPELVALGYVRPDQAYNFKVYDDLLQRGNVELQHKRSHD